MDNEDRRRLRDRTLDESGRDLDGTDPSHGAPSLLVQTTSNGSYPTTAQAFYLVSPMTILGAEVEGGAGSLTSAAGPFHAYNLGSGVPPINTRLLTTFVANRWVFRYE